MKRAGLLLVAVSLVLIAGCSSQAQVLAQGQPAAVAAAEKRGQFDLSCPEAKAEVLSSDYMQPAVQGAGWRGSVGVTRLEYTIGVQGCGKKEVYIVMCQEGTGTCVAAASHN